MRQVAIKVAERSWDFRNNQLNHFIVRFQAISSKTIVLLKQEQEEKQQQRSCGL